MMIIAAIIIGSFFVFGLVVGFLGGFRFHLWLMDWTITNWRAACAAWRDEAEIEKKQCEELRQWAEATIQNVGDAAAEQGLELRLNDIPVTPRRPDLKEWPDLIGEK